MIHNFKGIWNPIILAKDFEIINLFPVYRAGSNFQNVHYFFFTIFAYLFIFVENFTIVHIWEDASCQTKSHLGPFS